MSQSIQNSTDTFIGAILTRKKIPNSAGKWAFSWKNQHIFQKSWLCEGFWGIEKSNESGWKWCYGIKYVPWDPGGISNSIVHHLGTIWKTLRKSKKKSTYEPIFSWTYKDFVRIWSYLRVWGRKNSIFSKRMMISKICLEKF